MPWSTYIFIVKIIFLFRLLNLAKGVFAPYVLIRDTICISYPGWWPYFLLLHWWNYFLLCHLFFNFARGATYCDPGSCLVPAKFYRFRLCTGRLISYNDGPLSLQQSAFLLGSSLTSQQPVFRHPGFRQKSTNSTYLKHVCRPHTDQPQPIQPNFVHNQIVMVPLRNFFVIEATESYGRN